MGRAFINIPKRLRNQIEFKGVLILLLILLVCSSSIIVPLYYVSEKHIDNSTHNINDLRGVSGLTIYDLQMERNGDRLIIKTRDDFSILDGDLNYQYTLGYRHGGPRSAYRFEILGIFDNKLFVYFRFSSWDIYSHSGIIVWDLNTQELVIKKEIYYISRYSLSSDSSKLAISSNNSMFLIELTNPDLITEILVPYNYLSYSWIDSHQIAFFYSDYIVKHDTDNNSTISFDTITLPYYRKSLVISEDNNQFVVHVKRSFSN